MKIVKRLNLNKEFERRFKLHISRRFTDSQSNLIASVVETNEYKQKYNERKYWEPIYNLFWNEIFKKLKSSAFITDSNIKDTEICFWHEGPLRINTILVVAEHLVYLETGHKPDNSVKIIGNSNSQVSFDTVRNLLNKDIPDSIINDFDQYSIDEIFEKAKPFAENYLQKYFLSKDEDLSEPKKLSDIELENRVLMEDFQKKLKKISDFIFSDNSKEFGNLGIEIANLYRDCIIGTRGVNWKEDEQIKDAQGFWTTLQKILPQDLKFSDNELETVMHNDKAATDMINQFNAWGNGEFYNLYVDFCIREER